MKNIFFNNNHIAILGGTFNPVHNGHLYMADKTLEAYPEIEKIVFMPNNLTAYKDNDIIVSNKHRINMLKLACEGNSQYEISLLDIERGGTTYTIDTLRDIISINPSLQLDFIIGEDSLITIDKWFSYKEIFNLCRLIVIKRNDINNEIYNCRNKLLSENPNAKIDILDVPQINVSSTKIRESIKIHNYNIKQIPKNVLKYIQSNNLYV